MQEVGFEKHLPAQSQSDFSEKRTGGLLLCIHRSRDSSPEDQRLKGSRREILEQSVTGMEEAEEVSKPSLVSGVGAQL